MEEKMRENARELRRNMTRQERHLWYDFLKGLPVTVYRQKVLGRYIVDFYVSAPKTVIELDGSQHYREEGPEKDRERDEYLRERGCRVLRYPNNEVDTNFSGVCEDIAKHLGLSLEG